MSVKPYDEKEVRKIVALYWKVFPELPTKDAQIYLNEDAVMWDGYLDSVEELRELFSSLFRFAQDKEETDIKKAQEPGETDNLNIKQLAFFITDILVHEKTHQGLFSTMLKNGVVERVIQRLEVLLR